MKDKLIRYLMKRRFITLDFGFKDHKTLRGNCKIVSVKKTKEYYKIKMVVYRMHYYGTLRVWTQLTPSDYDNLDVDTANEVMGIAFREYLSKYFGSVRYDLIVYFEHMDDIDLIQW